MTSPPDRNPSPAPPGRIPGRGPGWLAWGGLLLLLCSLLGFGYHQHRLRQELQLGAAHEQEQKALGAATAWERHLATLQANMARLAAPSTPSFGTPSREAGLAAALRELPSGFLKGLLLLDADGNVLAAAPDGFPARSTLPVHLLKAPSTPDASLHRLDLRGEPLLVLSQPLPGDGNPQLLAVTSLPGLLGLCLPAGAETAGCFLLDESGHFLASDLPRLHGLPFHQAVDPAAQPDLFRVLSFMTRGEKGSRRLSALALPGLAGPAGEVLVSFHPLRTGGRQWSLALFRQIPRPPAGSLGLMGALTGAALLLPGLLRLQNGRRRAARSQQRLAARVAALEKELAMERKRFADLFENAGDALFFIDPTTGTLLQANRQAEELIGYSPTEIGNLSLAVLFPGRQRPRYLRLIRRVLNDGYGEDDNLLFRRKDGSLFAGSVHARLGHVGGRSVVHGVVRDVSTQRQMERQLRRRNRDLSLLNQLAQDLVARHDLKGRLQALLERVVPAFDAAGGGILLTRDQGTRLELVAALGIAEPLRRRLDGLRPGSGLVGLVAAGGRPSTSADLQRDGRLDLPGVLEEGWQGFQAVPVALEERTLGVLFLFSHEKRVLDREELTLLLTIGRQLGSAVTGADLFEELRWQNRLTEASNRELRHSRQQLRSNLEQLDQANRALGRLDRMKNQFLALASHELRTPLTYILSGTDLLATSLQEKLNPEEAKILEALRRGGLRLDAIVRDLLEVARIESRDLYLAGEPFEVNELLAELARDFTAVAEIRELDLGWTPLPFPLQLTGDRHHLKRCLERLLENAVKFTGSGGRVTIDAKVCSAAEIGREQRRLQAFGPTFFEKGLPKSLVQITVADSGLGIDPEEQLRVFDKFYEIGDIDSHFTSRSSFGGKGVGLGLTLVKGVVEAHGGMVWLESAGTGGDSGTAVHVLLPMTPHQETDDGHGPLFPGPADPGTPPR